MTYAQVKDRVWPFKTLWGWMIHNVPTEQKAAAIALIENGIHRGSVEISINRTLTRHWDEILTRPLS
jgi:hypothetical protein